MSIALHTHLDALYELKKQLHIGKWEVPIDPIDELINKLISDAKKHGVFSLQSVKEFVRERTTIWLNLIHENLYDSMLNRIAEEYEKELSQAIKPALAKWNSNKELFKNIDPNENLGAYGAALFRDRDQVASQIPNIKALRARCKEFDQMALVAREKGAEFAKNDPLERPGYI